MRDEPTAIPVSGTPKIPPTVALTDALIECAISVRGWRSAADVLKHFPATVAALRRVAARVKARPDRRRRALVPAAEWLCCVLAEAPVSRARREEALAILGDILGRAAPAEAPAAARARRPRGSRGGTAATTRLLYTTCNAV